MRPTPSASRAAFAAVLALPVAWLVYVATAVQRDVPEFRKLLEGLGSELPNLTSALFASYRWWWLAPVLSFLAGLDVVRRPKPSAWHFALVLTATSLLALALHAWFHQALLLPLRHILEAVD